MSGFQDSRTTEANHQRFVERVIGHELVFFLSNSDGLANSESNYVDEATVLPFWSDRAYAVRAQNAFSETFDVSELNLFDFLYRWLPGMSQDRALAGTNWDGNLVGKEIDPLDLREEIENHMPDELSRIYEAKYKELSGDA